MIALRLELLLSVDLNAGAHGGSSDTGLDVLALCCCGLCLDDSADECDIVVVQLLCAEADLTDGAVDDVGLVQTVLNLTSLSIVDSLLDVGGDGAGLGRGHQTLGAKDLTQTTDGTHHVGGSDNGIELEPVFLLDLLNQIHAASVICAGFLCLVNALGLAENENADGLTGAVGQNDSAADLLVSVTAVNTELYVQLDGLVELCLACGANQGQCLHGIIECLLINELGALFIILTSKHFSLSS